MTSKNAAALARFGELYKTAWVRLSERQDEIPHFGEIAASFDKLNKTKQGRDLVYLFRSTCPASFSTEGGGLVATRNRAAFMIALAQYKKELAAQASSAVTKPARRGGLFPIENPGATSCIDEKGGNYLCISNGTLRLEVSVVGFFPLAQANEKKIFPQIAGALDHKTAAKLHNLLCAYTAFLSGAELKRMGHNFDTLAQLLAQRPGFEGIAAEYKTAAAKASRITSSKTAA